MAPEGLVVVPTAELAQQVAAVASRLAAGLPSAPCVLLVSTAEELGRHWSGGGCACASRLQIVAIDEVDGRLLRAPPRDA